MNLFGLSGNNPVLPGRETANRPVAEGFAKRDPVVLHDPVALPVAETGKDVATNGSGQVRNPSEQAKHAEARAGIIAEHCDSLRTLATDKQICIAIRAVNKIAATLIRMGFATKDMAVKAKSSNIPPLSGLIPLDQTYGKNGYDPDKARKLTEMNLAAINNGSATAVDVILPADYLKLLSGMTIVGTWLNERPVDGSSPSGLLRGTDPTTGKEHTFVGEWQAGGKVRLFYSRMDKGQYVQGEPVKAMGNRSGQLMTADYDVAFIAPRIEDYGAAHTLPVKMTSVEEVEKRRGKPLDDAQRQTYLEKAAASFVQIPYEVTDSQDSPDGATAPSFHGRQVIPQKNLGNISRFLHALIPDLNAACGAEKGKELFHHGDDAGNLWTVENDNYPMTVILPDSDMLPEGTSGILIVENHTELKALYQTLKDSGFLPPTHFGWGDIASVRSERFNNAMDLFVSGIGKRKTYITSEMRQAPLEFAGLKRSRTVENAHAIFNQATHRFTDTRKEGSEHIIGERSQSFEDLIKVFEQPTAKRSRNNTAQTSPDKWIDTADGQ